MIIIEPISTQQSFVVTAKRDTSIGQANRIDFTDKETNVTVTVNITGYTEYDYYDTITLTINPALIENHVYRVVMYKNTLADERYRGLALVTSQIDSSQGFEDVEGFRLSDGQYTENTTTNEFTIYE